MADSTKQTQASSDDHSYTDADYPVEWETHAVLADGSAIELRPIRPADRDALSAFQLRQSKESIYFRFFRHRSDLTDSELDFFTQVDYQDRMAFVAMLGPTLVAVARYEKLKDKNEAEVAFFVDDDHHGRGLATLMLEYLAAAARQRGLQRFSATVLPENYRMLAVFRKAGFEAKSRFADGYIAVEMDIAVTEKASSVIADRDRQSRIRSVASIVCPKGIVVVGASRHPGAIGHELLLNLTGRDGAGGFKGPVVAVNKAAKEVAGQPAFATVAEAVASVADSDKPDDEALEPDGTTPGINADQPDPAGVIDLAVLAVPAVDIADIVTQCAESGIKSVFVVSSGFSEVGPVGEVRERELVDLVRSAGLRLVGPNAFGMVNTAPECQMLALYIDQAVTTGTVGLVSQSGPLGIALLQQLEAVGVGISTFVGVGNRADVSVNDLLDYWSADQATKVVVMYVENYGNLRNFAEAASNLSRTKSLLAISPSEPEKRDLLIDAGVILVDSASQLANQAKVAATQPVAKGRRVAIVGNTSSLARLALNACLANGLEVVVPLSATDSANQATVLIGDVDTVAMLPSTEPDDYEKIIVATAVAAEVDLVLIAIAPTPYLGAGALEGLLDRVNRSIDKPIVAVGLVGQGSLAVGDLPYFTYPEEAARALGVHADHGFWRRKTTLAAAEQTDDQPVDEELPQQLLSIIEALLPFESTGVANNSVDPLASVDYAATDGKESVDERSLTLANEEMADVLSQLDLPIADYGLGCSLDELLLAANRIGYPVVLKANIANRTVGEVGGAAIDLHDDASLGAAYARMTGAFGPSMSAAVVQRMVPSSELVSVELVHEPEFGSQIRLGLGSTRAQRQSTSGRCYLPLRPGDAAELVNQIFNQPHMVTELDRPLIEEPDHESEAPAATVLVHIVNQLAAVAQLTPLIAKLRLDPVLLNGTDTAIADVELTVRRRTASPLNEVRHL